MLTPEYLSRITEKSEEIASQLHSDIMNRIIERIMIRIGRGEDYLLTGTDRNQIAVLQEAGYLLEDIQRDIEKSTKLQQKEIRAAMEEAGIKAIQYDDVVYQSAGISVTPLTQSPHLVRVLQRGYEATMGEWSNFVGTTANEAQKLFIEQSDWALNQVMSGSLSYTQAVKESINKIIKDGVTINYPTGHTDTVETATARAVRAGIAKTAGDVSIARMEEVDWDIVLVSAHIGARTADGTPTPANHYYWQGKFYSRTGRTKEYPNFYESTGFGTGEGLSGWNCRHSFGSGDGKNNPFERYDSGDNLKQEELYRKQRAYECRIRSSKRDVAGLQKAVDSCNDEAAKFELQLELDKKSYLLQKRNSAYREFCKENNLKELQERLRIAEWNREVAAKARGAARRYKNSR